MKKISGKDAADVISLSRQELFHVEYEHKRHICDFEETFN